MELNTVYATDVAILTVKIKYRKLYKLGIFQFCRAHYDSQYSKFYSKRVNNIYLPKAKYLRKVIKEKINLVDVGCGAGHFVSALEKLKLMQ